MKTETINKYICDYCGGTHWTKQDAEECEASCKERLEWEKHTSPKFKIGDVVKTEGMCNWAFIVKFSEKHKVKNTWVYSGTLWYTEELKKEIGIEISDAEYFHALCKEEEEDLNLMYTAQEFEEIRKRISDKFKVADIGVTTDGGFGVVIKLEEI